MHGCIHLEGHAGGSGGGWGAYMGSLRYRTGGWVLARLGCTMECRQPERQTVARMWRRKDGMDTPARTQRKERGPKRRCLLGSEGGMEGRDAQSEDGQQGR